LQLEGNIFYLLDVKKAILNDMTLYSTTERAGFKAEAYQAIILDVLVKKTSRDLKGGFWLVSLTISINLNLSLSRFGVGFLLENNVCYLKRIIAFRTSAEMGGFMVLSGI
jgi:hypothetical protein